MTTLGLFRDSRDTSGFAPGQIIFQEGDPGQCMYVVVEGEVEISHAGRFLRRLGPGEIFGEMALIEHGPRSATATARAATKLAVIDERRFNFLIQQTPFFALQVMRVMAERLRANTPGPA